VGSGRGISASRENGNHSEEVLVGALVWIGILLLILWAVLWLGFHIVAGVIHLIVLVAIVMIVWGLMKRGARAVGRHV
jgi:hypothetical protein